MRFLKKIMGLSLLLSVIYVFGDFIAKNQQSVKIAVLGTQYGPIPLFFLIIITFSAGILLMILLMMIEFIRANATIKGLNRKIKKLNKEISKNETLD